MDLRPLREDKKSSFATALGKIVIVIVAVVTSTCYRAYVLHLGYTYFMVPTFSLPTLSIGTVFCCAYFCRMIGADTGDLVKAMQQSTSTPFDSFKKTLHYYKMSVILSLTLHLITLAYNAWVFNKF